LRPCDWYAIDMVWRSLSTGRTNRSIMAADDRFSPRKSDEHVASTLARLATDRRRLQQLWADSAETEIVIQRTVDAIKQSEKFLKTP